jgi:hypothetical protein
MLLQLQENTVFHERNHGREFRNFPTKVDGENGEVIAFSWIWNSLPLPWKGIVLEESIILHGR